MVGSFTQDVHDYLDIWNDIEPGQRVQVAFDYTTRIQELTDAWFSIFGASKSLRLRSPARPDQPDDWTVAVVQVVRSGNPRIVKHEEVEIVAYFMPRTVKCHFQN